MRHLITIVFLAIGLFLANGHVRMREPPNRSSIWRDPRFSHLNLTANYDDDGLYCGRVHQPIVVKTCGICGDPWIDPVPRANEHGGIYGQGVLAGNYSSGQEIAISAEFTIAHRGYMQFHLCDEIPESEECFSRNPILNIISDQGNSTDYIIPDELPMWLNFTIVLPQGLNCNHCVLRLHYRAGNNWGDCEDGSEGLGCGIQETFRSCADISISSAA